MKRYSEYKDSGVKWIGEIPRHWECRKLKTLLLSPLQYGANASGVPYSEHLPRYIRITDITLEGKLKHSDKLSLSNEDAAKYILKDKDILFARSGASVGKTFLYKKEYGLSAFAGYLIKAELGKELIPELLFYFTQSDIYESWKNGIFIQSTIQNIGADKYSQLQIALPPLPEQEAIVTYLDTKVAKIDEYISIAEKKIAALEELKQTIIAEAVTRGIHKDVPMKDSGVKWIGMIPEHWDLIRAQNMVDCRKAGAWGEDSRKDERDRICLRIADFDYSICRFKRTGDYTIRNYKQEQISSLYLNKGDILIEKSGGGEKTPVGRAILYDLDFYQPLYANFMEKITLREFASSSFYVYLLRTFYAKGCVWKYIKQTTGLQNLDLRAMLGSETFPVPPLPEQQEIVTYIEAKVANINQLCQAERSQIEKLKEYKQRLISDVVTGKVKVTNDSLNGRV